MLRLWLRFGLRGRLWSWRGSRGGRGRAGQRQGGCRGLCGGGGLGGKVDDVGRREDAVGGWELGDCPDDVGGENGRACAPGPLWNQLMARWRLRDVVRGEFEL